MTFKKTATFAMAVMMTIPAIATTTSSAQANDAFWGAAAGAFIGSTIGSSRAPRTVYVQQEPRVVYVQPRHQPRQVIHVQPRRKPAYCMRARFVNLQPGHPCY